MTLRVQLAFDARCKSRLLLTLENGEQVALIVDRGRVLRNAERVKIADGREVEIVSAPECLLQARSPDALLIAKAAYHLGNRHVAVQLSPEWLRILADHVLEQMLTGLGLEVTTITAPFEPEGGAYGHQHAHGSETPATRPRIHSFTSA